LTKSRLTLVGTTLAHAHFDNLALPALETYLLAQPDLASSWRIERITAHHQVDAVRFSGEIQSAVEATAPDILGLNCHCWDLDAQLELASLVKRRWPRSRVVLGGPSATSAPAELLESAPAVDVLVRGEGEVRLAQLLRRTWSNLHHLPGIVARRPDGSVFETQGAPEPLPLECVPSPYTQGVFRPRGSAAVIEASRGCRFRCKYCDWKRGGTAFRRMPTERLRADLQWAVREGYREVFLLHSAINSSTDHVRSLVDAARWADPDRRLGYTYFLDAGLLQEEQVELLSQLRIHRQEIGLNTTNPVASRITARSASSPERFAAQMEKAVRIGGVVIHLIVGMPGDDLNGYRRTLDYTAQLVARLGGDPVQRIRVFWMVVPPGSELHDKRDELGIVIEKRGVPFVRGTATMNSDDFREALRMTMEHEIGPYCVIDGPRSVLQEAAESPFRIRGGVLVPNDEFVA